MLPEPRLVDVERDSELAKLLDLFCDEAFILSYRGRRWHIAPDGNYFDPLAAHESVIGSWKDRDVDQMIRDIYAARAQGSRPPERPYPWFENARTSSGEEPEGP